MDEQSPKKLKKLTFKQRKFVQELLANPQGTQTEAYMAIANVNRTTASTKASELMAKPHVQAHINDQLARLYPNMSETASNVLMDALQDEKTPLNSKLKIIELLAKFQGWAAPTKVDKRELKVDLSKFKLPGSDG